MARLREVQFARQALKDPRGPQHEFAEVRIEDVKLDIKSRDEIPALPIGLQFLHSQEALRDRLFLRIIYFSNILPMELF